MTESDFLADIQKKCVTGKYDLSCDKSDELMDRDFKDIKFLDCHILGGNFLSSSFNHCDFLGTKFERASLVGVSFLDCQFDNLVLSACETELSITGAKSN